MVRCYSIGVCLSCDSITWWTRVSLTWTVARATPCTARFFYLTIFFVFVCVCAREWVRVYVLCACVCSGLFVRAAFFFLLETCRTGTRIGRCRWFLLGRRWIPLRSNRDYFGKLIAVGWETSSGSRRPTPVCQNKRIAGVRDECESAGTRKVHYRPWEASLWFSTLRSFYFSPSEGFFSCFK